MTRDDIIRMAREAGWSGLYITYNEPTGKADWEMVKERLTVPVTMEQIERFAALVAAAERDACAKVAEKMLRFYTQAVTGVPEAIRARGAEPQEPNNPGECTECHARAGSVCSDADCPGRMA